MQEHVQSNLVLVVFISVLLGPRTEPYDRFPRPEKVEKATSWGEKDSKLLERQAQRIICVAS